MAGSRAPKRSIAATQQPRRTRQQRAVVPVEDAGHAGLAAMAVLHHQGGKLRGQLVPVCEGGRGAAEGPCQMARPLVQRLERSPDSRRPERRPGQEHSVHKPSPSPPDTCRLRALTRREGAACGWSQPGSPGQQACARAPRSRAAQLPGLHPSRGLGSNVSSGCSRSTGGHICTRCTSQRRTRLGGVGVGRPVRTVDAVPPVVALAAFGGEWATDATWGGSPHERVHALLVYVPAPASHARQYAPPLTSSLAGTRPARCTGSGRQIRSAAGSHGRPSLRHERATQVRRGSSHAMQLSTGKVALQQAACMSCPPLAWTKHVGVATSVDVQGCPAPA